MKKNFIFLFMSLLLSNKLLSETPTFYPNLREIQFFNSYEYKGKYYNLPLQTTIYLQFWMPHDTGRVLSTDTINQDNIKVYLKSNERAEVFKNTTIYIDITKISKDTVTYCDTWIFVNLDYNKEYELVVTTNIRYTFIQTPTDYIGLDKEYRYTFFSVVSTTFTSYLLKQPTTSQPHTDGNVELLIYKNEYSPEEVYFATNLLTETTEYLEAEKKLPSGYDVLFVAEFRGFKGNQKLENSNNYLELRGYKYSSNCSFYWLDEKNNIFIKIPTFSTQNGIFANVKKYGIYAVVEEPKYLDIQNVRCYPVPWVPDSEKSYLGNYTEGIKFDNLPYGCTIEIYSLSGDLVHKKEFFDLSGIYNWNGKNDAGKDCASGVYIWVVKTQLQAKKGKLIIIR